MVTLANIESPALVTRWNHTLERSLLCQKHNFFLELSFSTQETTTFCLNWKYQTRVSHFKRVLKVWVKRKTNNSSASLPSSVTPFKHSFQAAKKQPSAFRNLAGFQHYQKLGTAYSAATFPSKWGVCRHGTSGGHTKKWIISTLIQRNIQADPRPIPTCSKKPLSGYLTSGVDLSHVLSKNGSPSW